MLKQYKFNQCQTKSEAIYNIKHRTRQESMLIMRKTKVPMKGDTKQSRLESTTEITQNKHVKVLHYFVDDIK